MKILAVDDDESILTIIHHCLSTNAQNDVYLSVSAKDALEKINFAEARFDYFLIDVQMPLVDGIQLTELIRQTPGYELSPILMLTAMHEKSYLERAFKAGATDYVCKPFDFKSLRSRIFDARQLAWQKAQTKHRMEPQQSILWSRGIAQDLATDTKIKLGTFSGLIGYGEFENYALELARRSQCKVMVQALKIADPKLGAFETSLDEFSDILGQTTHSLNSAFPEMVSAMSYRGNGTFLCLTENNFDVPNNLVENEVNARLLRNLSTLDIPRLRIFAGVSVSLKAASDADVFERLQAAADNVERRFNSKAETASISKRFLRRSLLSDDQHRLEQKSYQSVMREMLVDMNDDQWLKRLYRR